MTWIFLTIIKGKNKMTEMTNMTEKLLQKVEEKMMMLLTEVEDLRKENHHLRYENTSLKNEKEKQMLDKANSERKLTDIIALLDSVANFDTTPMTNQPNLAAVKPVLVQG